MEFQIKPVNFNQQKEICLEFRRDAHWLSYGTLDNFNVDECLGWFESLIRDNPNGFKHVYIGNQIIGQLEFKSAILDKSGDRSGYINLLYLLPDCRRKGYGLQLQNYIFSQFIEDGCLTAYLRYLPVNIIAGNFYKKQGWAAVGEPNERGQLMMYKL